MVRILIVDDHDVVRSGVRAVLEAHAGWVVVGEAADGHAAVKEAIATRPDVVVLDYLMPFMNGADATRQIRAKLPATEVLIFTAHDAGAVVRDALAAGVKGYVLKSDPAPTLVAAVELLAMHQPFFTDTISDRLINSYVGNLDATSVTFREK
jgi:DNA-binding NarL/FixJ family response regulator